MTRCDVAIIGAGPAGCVAAKFLADAGMSVIVLEAQHFPRFVIGESLLPFCMNILEKSGLADAVCDAGFQFKNGAAFARGDEYRSIDFREKFEQTGWGTTFQVKRSEFDALLAEETAKAGVDIRFGHRVQNADLAEGDCRLSFVTDTGENGTIVCGFVLDASGYGRVIPRLTGQENRTQAVSRRALFTHMRDRISDAEYDRGKILITVHPQFGDIWYWLIPFSDGTASVGVVYPHHDHQQHFADLSDQAIFDRLISETGMGNLLADATPIRDLTAIAGYTVEGDGLWGDGYALLGNSAGFLDPVFSSGVTIAMQSADLATQALIRRHRGEKIDWQADYADPLSRGIATFKSYVEAWYDGRLQTIIFNQPDDDRELKRMVVSILAGYAWNTENPLVAKTDRYLSMLHDLCA
jgi:flavin-dependent dehydrogenase